jgi:predicted MFS family arabinose efflux permease
MTHTAAAPNDAAMSRVDERDLRYPGWRVALAAGVGVFCWSVPPFSFTVFLKPLAEEFAWSRESVSAVFGLAALVAAACAAPAGYLLDKVGARAVVIPALTVAAVVFALRAFLAPPFWHVAALFALTGVAGIGTSPMAYVRVVATWFDARRGLALGVAISGAALGAMVHPPVAQALIDAAGWRRAHLILAAFMLCVGVPVVAVFLRPRPRPAGVAEPAAAATGATLGEGLSSWMFWVLAVVLLCDATVNGSVTVHLPALLTDRGVSGPQSAVALSAMGGAAFIGRLVVGWIIDRAFAVHISIALIVLSAAGAVVLAAAETFAAGTTGAMLVGFGMGGEADVTPYLLSRYFGLRAFSTLYGVMFMATGIAWAIGPALMGRSFDATGSYSAHLLLLAVLLVAAAALMLTLPRYPAPATDAPR